MCVHYADILQYGSSLYKYYWTNYFVIAIGLPSSVDIWVCGCTGSRISDLIFWIREVMLIGDAY